MAGERVEAPEIDLERRHALKVLGGGLAAVAAGKAVDNVLLGYEHLGTNLHKQDLAGLVAGSFFAGVRRTDIGDGRVLLWDDVLRVDRGESTRATYRYPALSADRAATIDAEHGLDGYVERGVPALATLHGDVRLEFSQYDAFLERVRAGEPHPEAVELLRSHASAAPGVVREFADANPADTGAVIEGLADGFREHTGYDFERYAAGSIQDNVLFGAADLRAPFRGDVEFRSLLDGSDTGLFCYEFTDRSIEALQAVPASEQTAPVFAGSVYDERHKHVYTAVGSVLRGEEAPVVPVTFLDYTHVAMYDDLTLRGLLGEGLAAYDRRHMATSVRWS